MKGMIWPSFRLSSAIALALVLISFSPREKVSAAPSVHHQRRSSIEPRVTIRSGLPVARARLELSSASPVTMARFNRSIKRAVMLDTGARQSFISTRLARALGLTEKIEWVSHYRAVDGSSIRAPVARIDRIDIGELTIRGLLVALIDHPGSRRHSGALGIDALKNIRFEVDRSSSSIRFRLFDGPEF